MRLKSERERGAALLTVLLLVSVVGALAAMTLEKLNVSSRLASNSAALAQARAYSSAAETMALIRINSLIGQGETRITLDGGWSDKPFPLPVPDGIAAARIRDGGNCFNLNSLVTQSQDHTYVASQPAITQFARLMTQIGVPPGSAAPIAAAAADWIDSDADALPGGAEDPAYTSRTPAYRTANTLMGDVSEFRTIAGVTPDIYRRVRPFVCALPVTDAARINVNTLQPEQGALVSMMLPDTVTPDQVNQVLLSRPAGGWASAATFWNDSSLKNRGTPPEGLAITTRWFVLRSDVTIGRTSFTETGLIDADQPPARLVSRQWGAVE